MNNVEKARELKSKVTRDSYGYHNEQEVDIYDEEVEKITSPLKKQLIKLIEENPVIREYLDIEKELSQVNNVSRGFNFSK
jgi:hypothetical protein